MDDDKVWQLARTGDEQMFYELVRRYERPLFGFLARHVGDTARAEDLFQDTFLIVHRNRRQQSAKGHFRAWLYAIALNVLRSRARKAKQERQLGSVSPRVQDKSGEVVGDPGEILPDERQREPVEVAARSEESGQIQAALAELPQKHRDIVLLRIYQRLSFEEIAHVTGETVGTLKSRMFYALRKLRPKLMHIARGRG